jgi:hypothetical protein
MTMRIQRLTLVGAVTLLGVLALSAAPAAAKTGYANICSTLGTVLCVPGGVGGLPAEGVAVDNSSGSSAGDVWVAYGYYGVGELVKFDASGERVGEAEVGSIQFPTGASRQVAVDPTSGDVYLASASAVTKFDSSGAVLSQITETPLGAIAPPSTPGGMAVDADGNLYVADPQRKTIEKFNSSGAYIESISIPGMLGYVGASIAVGPGPEGPLYVGLTNLGRVEQYSSTGAPVDCPDGNNFLPAAPNSEVGLPLAVDPSDGHLFVGEQSASEGFVVAEYSSFCAGASSATFGGGEIGESAGIGVNGSTHEVYVGTYFGGKVTTQETLGAVQVYGLITVPTVTTSAPAASITRASAVVSGTVNPEGTEVTVCEFEYGSTAAYGHSVPCEQPLPLTGGSPVAVSAEIKTAEPPASLVYYRLKAANSAGREAGAGESFRLESFASPVVGGLPASSVTQFAATLNGTLQTGEALVNYRFEYGTSTAYGTVEPIPDGYTPIAGGVLPVSQPLRGLRAGTTYHYRLLASSPGGTDVAGPDETFTTLPIPTPTVATGSVEGVGVGSATLTGTIDPHGWDTTYLFEYGTNTSYGLSWPTVQVDMGALEGPQPVVVNVPNLLPGTTYHYRLVAINGGGTSYGPDMTFTTGEYPAPAIQEPVAFKTLLVPSGEIAKAPSAKKGRKAKKRARRGKAGRHAKGRGHGTRGRKKK